MADHETNEKAQAPNILDTIMGNETLSGINEFEPAALVRELLDLLKTRDQDILSKRFGLDGVAIETLEAIGKKNNLTRERVRQIEKDSIALLKQSKNKNLQAALSLVFDCIVEYGNIISEDFLIQTLLYNKSATKDAQAVKFLLSLGEQFKFMREDENYYSSWYVVGFAPERLAEVIGNFVAILKQVGKAMPQDELYTRFKDSDYFKQHDLELTDKVLKSYLNISKHIQANPFGEIGLSDWNEIRPRDVGDKAFLVLRHHQKPEHYSAITRLINEHKFDGRSAFQETVHNELIKDERFVLIGRGIYALSEWGYKKGVVADVIREVLAQSAKPLTRNEIIAEVQKRRQVKRNTILVGLSNKKFFQKVGRDRYGLATEETAPAA
ncbi:MAG TPA: sigma factor-like helix-turn-helix DNA-binding protein [Patescibacteria group bacterium]|nr:sigma factor-like helix-turn-helix DNA-binding protein [Patescibacteria group bacterium]